MSVVALGTLGCFANLSAAAVDVTAIARRKEVASGIAMIIVDASGQNQIVVAPGANETLSLDLVAGNSGLFRHCQAVMAQLESPLAAISAFIRVHLRFPG